MPQAHNNLPCYVETIPGIEEVAWLEIRDRFPQANFGEFMFAKDERGIVLFEHNGVLSDLFSLRTIEAAFVVGAYLPKISRGYRDLRELREQVVDTGDFGRAVNALSRYRRRQITTYNLVTKMYGRHEYNRMVFRQAVIQGLEALYPDWKRVQTDADVDIWANVFGSIILIGLRIPPPAGWRPAAESDPFPESAAAATVLLTRPGADDTFLDPLCGTGALVGPRTASPAHLILGGDPDPDHVSEAQRRLQGRAACLRWEPGALPLAAASVDKVASRFPFLAANAVHASYSSWLGELQRVLRTTGRAVILTRQYDQFRDAIREYSNLVIRGGYSVTIGQEWGRIYVVERVA